MKEDKTHLQDMMMMNIKRIIREEVNDFEWIKGSNKWDDLLNSMEMLANNRRLNPKEDPEVGLEYWTRKDFKIWLGQTSDEDYKQLRDLVKAKGFRSFGNDNWVMDSLYITVDRGYTKKEDRVIFGMMGCQKEVENMPLGQRYYWDRYTEEEKEMKLCQKVGNNYRVKPKKLEYDRKYFDSRDDAQELFL